MNALRTLALAAAALCCASAGAAVTLPPGTDLPPPPNLRVPADPGYWQRGAALPAYVIQTSAGAIECPRRWFEAAACRTYMPGQERRPRAFVRQQGGWVVCSRPQGAEGCVGIRELPQMIEQD